jgi:gliding motility-associated-like protein
MAKFYKSILLGIILCVGQATAQTTACTSCSNVPSFTVNLSSNPNNSYTVSSVRNNKCCQGIGSDACIVFYVTVHPQATEIKFFKSGGNNGNYQIDCMAPSYNPTNPVCLNGLTQFCITYCNPGNNNDTYTITTSAGFSVSPNFTVNQGCTAKMYVSGLTPASVTWNSIFPGVSGQYNPYLSCLSGCDTTYVTPAAGAPAFIDYRVCGTKAGCSSGTVCDTIRVFTSPSLSVSITPSNPTVCFPTTTVALTATASGGVLPYSYTWTPGPVVSQSIAAGIGTYTVTVKDGSSGCPFKTATVSVGSGTTPPSPTPGSNSPICAGQTLSLTATTVPGATLYSWTGPASYSSSIQNPSIANATLTNAGNYSVTATVGGCVSAPSTISVTISNAPGSPTAGSNGPICAGQTLSLTANTIAGATYSWTGPNSFSSNLQNPTIVGAGTVATGVYSVFASVGGCNGPIGTISVTVKPIPASPTLSSNAPLCVGQTLSLTASTIAGATYNWSGPNGFSSANQNTVIVNAQIVNSGNYTVTATLNGCPGVPSTLSVTIAPPPGSLTLGSNAPICAGQNLSLTASTIAGATYSWSGPNGFSSSLQNPVILGASVAASGAYTAFATVGGCTGPVSTINVTVNPIPSLLILGSNSPICATQNLNLTSNLVAGGTYSWSGPNTFGSSLQNPTIVGASTLASGTYSAYVTVNGCNSPTATIGVTVNPIPATPTPSNNSPICAGNNLTFTVGSVVGASYSWTGPNTFVSAAQNPTIVGASTVAAGSYSLIITVNGCSSAAGITIATVTPLPAAPVAGSNGPICAGQTLSLTASAIAGATYSWTGPNAFTSNLQNPTIIGTTTAATGMYTVFATVNGCGGPIGTISVTVKPIPVSPTLTSNSPLCVGQTLSLTASTLAGATYNWNGPNGFSSTNQNTVIANAQIVNSGNYTLTATVNGCTSPPSVISVTIAPPPGSLTLGSNAPICANQNLSLTASFISGATYSWTGPNGFNSTLQNPVIVGASSLATGAYTAFATVGGCTGPVTILNLTVNAIPGALVLGSNSPICAGQNINLTSNLVAGGTYSWSGPNSFSSSLQNPSIVSATTSATGSYSAFVTVNGCNGPVSTVNVTVNPIPATPTPSNNSPICVGNNLTFTIGIIAGASYSWTGPNSFNSAVQNPTIVGAPLAASGSYSLFVTVNGCSSSAGITIATVSPLPAAPVAASNGPICAGQTLSLTASSVAGATYSWTGPNTFNSLTQNPTIIGATTLATGMYSVYATVNGCKGPAGTVSVTVNPTPNSPTLSTNSPLCVGQTLSLTASTIAGASYSWLGPNGFSSTSQNTTIVNSQTVNSGNYTVTATLNGCTSAPAVISVTISPPPGALILASNSPVCAGQNLSLTASFISGATYSWTGPNGFNSSLQNPVIVGASLAANGNYTAFATVGSCTGPIATLNVTINPIPSPLILSSNSPICAGSNLNFTANLVAGGTYSWSGPNSFTANIQNPTITGASTLASGAYSANVTVNGCPSTFAIINVTVFPIPATPTPSNNSPICVGNNLTFTIGNTATASYSWSGPNGFSSAVQNPTIVGASLAASGTYSLIVTVNGCSSSPGITIATVSPLPASPTPGSNSPICAFQTLSLTANTIAGATYSWSGPNSFTSNLQNPTIPNASTLAAGNYSVFVNVNGCSGPFAVIAVTINPAPASPTVSSNSPVCVGSTLSFSASGIAGGSYQWSGPNSFSSANQNTLITNAPTTATGIYSVFATLNGCPGLTSTISLVVSAQPTVAAGANQTVCANNSTVNLNGFSSTTSGTWTSAGTGAFSPNNVNGNYIPSAADISSGSVVLTLHSTNNGGCSSVTNTMLVNFSPSPVVNAGSSQTVCANNSTMTLSGSVTTATGGIWSTNGTGTFVPNNTSLNTQYVPSAADIANGSVVFTLTSTGNGNCFPVTNTCVVSISPAPVVSAGPSVQIVCKNNPNYQLNGTSTTGSVTWSSNGTGTFSPNANILNPIYFSSTADTTAGSVVIFITSSNNGGCNPVTTSITLTYVSTITVNAGPSQTVCSNNPNVSLNGASTTSAGVWNSSGTGIFSPSANSLTTTYIPSAADIGAGMVTLTLTTTNNGGCLPIKSTMTVIITPGPTANAGPNQTVCANAASVALSGSFAIATGAVWSSSGSGTFTPNNTNMNTTYLASNADTTAGSVLIFLTTTGNGNCFPTVDTMKITFKPAPLVNGGGNISVCKGTPTVGLNGYSSTNSGTWTTMGTGTFSPSNAVLNPTYAFSTADTTAGSVTLILTSINNGGCNPVSNTVVVTFFGNPTITAGVDMTVCANNSNVNLNGSSSTNSGTWTSSGTGIFSPNTITGVYVPSGADISAGSVTLSITSTNNGGCVAVNDVMFVDFSPAPTVSAGSDVTVCATSSVAVGGSVTIASGGTWTTSGTGTFVPAANMLNTGYIPSSADTLNGSVTLYFTSTGNGNCNPAIDSMKITFVKAPFASAGNNVSICKNQSSLSLNGQSSAGTVTWTTLGGGVFSPNNNVNNPTYTPSSSDTANGSVLLIMNVPGNANCSDAADTILVNFTNVPKADFISANRCINAATSFSNISSAGSSTVSNWLWYITTDTTTVLNPSYTFTSTGNYTISLVVNNGCKDSLARTIRINPAADVGFSSTVLCNEQVQFASTATVSSGTILNWSWNFGDSTTSIIQNPSHTYSTTGTYITRHIIVTDSGCVSSAADTIQVLPCDDTIQIGTPAVPNAFTPNGDGRNDILFVKGGPFKEMEFRVFNEWGNQIFMSTDRTVGWDGTFKNKVQPQARYIWTLTCEVIDGRVFKLAGETYLTK